MDIQYVKKLVDNVETSFEKGDLDTRLALLKANALRLIGYLKAYIASEEEAERRMVEDAR